VNKQLKSPNLYEILKIKIRRHETKRKPSNEVVVGEEARRSSLPGTTNNKLACYPSGRELYQS